MAKNSRIPQHVIRRHDPALALHPHIDRGRGEDIATMNAVIDRIVEIPEGLGTASKVARWIEWGDNIMHNNPILDWLTGYRALTTVSVACELRLFAMLDEQPQSADELARRAGANPGALKALLDAGVGLGLLHHDGERYRNSQLAEAYLVEDRPLYLGHLIHVFAAEAPTWQGLHDLVRYREVPEVSRSSGRVEPHRFTLAMHSLALLGEAEALANAVALDGCRDLVDVGCGSGAYSMSLCRRYPELRATLIDTEEVLQTTRQLVEQSGLAERMTLVARDMTRESYGDALCRDVVLLSDVLYDTAEVCMDILRLAHRALRPGGTLIIRGYFSDPKGTQSGFGALFDLARILWNPTREPIAVLGLRQWVQDAGFRQIETFALTQRSTGLVARKR